MISCNIGSEPLSCLRRGLSLVLGVLLAIFMSQVALAQTFSASIAGTVTDATGAVVHGAKLELQNTNSKDIRLQTTGDDGSYAFSNLLPGTYKLSVSAPGFKDYEQTDMVLPANTAAIINVPLQIGSTSEQVVVNAGGAVLQNTASANNAVSLESEVLRTLPNNTLQPLNFVFAFAGTTESQGMTSRSASLDQFGSMFGLNGGRSAEAAVLVDGAPSTAVDWGGMMVSPMQDSVQEQQVVQNVYDAQYERGGEGIVTLITKSGGQMFHGEVYDYMRNNGLDANSWYNGYHGYKRGKFHRNQFGGNIGGPVLEKYNLFFFGAYEGLRQPGGNNVYTGSVPTDAERGGDFSNTLDSKGNLIVIYNPFSTHQVTDSAGNTYYTRDPFPGNQIPSGLLNSTGQKLVNLYPHANRAANGGVDNQNFTKGYGDTTTNDKFDWRIDWAHSASERFFARMSDRLRQDDDPTCVFCNGGDSNYANKDHGLQVVANNTWTPSQSWVVDAYGAYSRWSEGQLLVGFGKTNATAIGLPANIFQVPILPVVNATGYSGMGAGDSSYDVYVRYLETGLVNVTKQLTRHTLKFGFNYDVNMINNRKDGPGTFNFSGAMTTCDPGPVAGGPCQAKNSHTGTSGNAIADMLLGAGNGETHQNMDPAMSEHTYGMYVQDDWRMTPKLTVTAGFRYENQRPATERYNRVAYFDPKAINPISTAFGSTLYGAFEFAGTGGRGRDAWEPDNKDFGPRLGFAYRFNDKLVGRLGGGIFYGPTSAMLSFDGDGQSPGFTAKTPWIGTQDGNGYILTNLASNPFPNGINKPSGNSLGAMTYVGYGAGQMWPKLPHPAATIYQWSLDFQYQVNPHAIAQIGYTGVRGRKLLFGNPNLDLDQLPTSKLALGGQLDAVVPNPFYGVITDPNSYLSGKTITQNLLMRPFPEFGWLQQTRSLPGARSQFDALNARYNYTFHNGVASITTYQWSKNLDDGSEALLGWGIGGSWRDATNPKLDYSLSTHDAPQSFVETFLYQLPYGTGRRHGATAPQIVRQTVGGWNVSGIARLTSGYPLWIPVQWGWNPLGNYGFPGNAMPNLVGNAKPAHRTVTNWINPDAFQGLSSLGDGSLVTCGVDPNCQPLQYKYGNEPQHFSNLREAATKNFDIGIAKEFGTEKIKAEFRGDFLNAFNHPVYGGTWNITNHFGWGPIGQVQGTRNDPRNIQVALKVMF